jgi:hypothetical protein
MTATETKYSRIKFHREILDAVPMAMKYIHV